MIVAEKNFHVIFKDKFVGKFRCDIFVEGRVTAELKSVTGFIPKLFKVRCYLI